MDQFSILSQVDGVEIKILRSDHVITKRINATNTFEGKVKSREAEEKIDKLSK